MLKTHEPAERFHQVHRAVLDHVSYSEADPVVLIVREPKDTATSYYYYTYFRNRRRGGHWSSHLPKPVQAWLYRQFRLRWFVVRVAHAWSAFVLSWQAKNPVVVRYEDLVAAPFDTVQKVTAWLGLEFSAKYMAEAVDFCSLPKMREAEDRLIPGIKDERERHFRVGKTGQWHDLFTPEMQREFDAITREAARLIGYAKPEPL